VVGHLAPPLQNPKHRPLPRLAQENEMNKSKQVAVETTAAVVTPKPARLRTSVSAGLMSWSFGWGSNVGAADKTNAKNDYLMKDAEK
jgi:hypothetical protein